MYRGIVDDSRCPTKIGNLLYIYSENAWHCWRAGAIQLHDVLALQKMSLATFHY